MPTYQYACTVPSCGHRFEAVQTFTESALTICPVCDGGLRKVFSPVGVVFKGSGFYRNDSRNADKKRSSASTEKSEKTEKTDASSSSSNGSATSDSSSSTSSKSGSSDAKSTASTTTSSTGQAASS